MQKYLEPTPMLDFKSPALATLIEERGWAELPTDIEKIRSVYDFVRDEIVFGYNDSDDMPASKILADGYGQCNTKTTLLMALLRGLNIPCRFHGATIHKELQRGAITGVWFQLAPAEIIHSWAEVCTRGNWVKLEGVIIDAKYLDVIQHAFPPADGAGTEFFGYGIATKNIRQPEVEWEGRDTAIQKEGISKNLGVFDSPDAFYKKHGVNMTPLKRFLYSRFVRHQLNKRINSIRDGSTVVK